MIIVIQCAATKLHDAGMLRTRDGTPVKFVADPSKAPSSEDTTYARPDDPSDAGPTWRQMLLRYNRTPQNNPLGLTPAYLLYKHPVYRRLAEQLGTENVYILSAGWGLVSANFLTPDYDITFSTAVKKKAPHKFRHKTDHFEDLCLLPREASEPIMFFGGKDYVPLFCALTSGINCTRTIFYNSARAPDAPNCSLVRFETSTRTNWHYECATAYLDGKIAIGT